MIARLLTRLDAIPADKVRHFAGGAVLTCALYVLGLPFWLAAAAVIASALGKEAYDAAHPENHTSDLYDALATILGGATVLLPLYLTL